MHQSHFYRSLYERYSYAGRWPSFVFFTPIVIYYIFLAIKHRGFTALYANPGLEYSGYLDDSKIEMHALFEKMKPENILTTKIISCSLSLAEKESKFKFLVASGVLEFPVIFKPDRGLRGIGVKIIYDFDQAKDYLSTAKFDVLAQEYCSYDNEGSIYFRRDPKNGTFEILGVTIKEIPSFIGDGQSTLGRLIEKNPHVKFHKENLAFEGYLDLSRVLQNEELFVPEIVPCVSTGCRYYCGDEFITAETTAWLDESTRHYSSNGVYIGRFDVKFNDLNSLKTGRNLKFIELNGVGAELNHLYDPQNSALKMYQLYFKQLDYVYEIGKTVLELSPKLYTSKIRLVYDVIRFFGVKKDFLEMDESGFNTNRSDSLELGHLKHSN